MLYASDSNSEWLSEEKDYAKIVLAGEEIITPILFEQDKIGVISGIPIVENDEVVGAVIVYGSLINHGKLDDLKKQTGSDFTIFANDKRVSTTVTLNEERQVGSVMSKEVYETVILSGEEYSGHADVVGIDYTVKYIPLKRTDGVVIGALFTGRSSEGIVEQNFKLILYSAIAATFFGLLMILFFRRFIKKYITAPLTTVVDAAHNISNGKFDIDITYRSNDEIGSLLNAFMEMCERFGQVTNDLSYIFTELAQGNLAVESRDDEIYVGDLTVLSCNVSIFIKKINQIMLEIRDSSNVVLEGANQVSDGAQDLAEGATEQAKDIGELVVNLDITSEKISLNADNAKKADILAVKATNLMKSGQEEMSEMIDAINIISGMSNDITKIISVIEDISFQTNILSLNASVEAARAGNEGRGFAVVADEIRNLAKKSSDAVKGITQLIENTIEAVEKGGAIAKETNESFEAITENSQEIIKAIDKILNASLDQSEVIDNIKQKMQHVFSIVISNSASSEESAAASEELSRQAHILKDLEAQFKLTKRDH